MAAAAAEAVEEELILASASQTSKEQVKQSARTREVPAPDRFTLAAL